MTISFHGTGLKARNLTFKKIVKKVMKDRFYNQFMVQMEKMIRRVVQEELHRIQPRLSSSWVSIERSRLETPSSRQRFKLRFINSPPSSIFTGSKILAEDGSPVAIELVDIVTNARVVTGQLSSSRVEIMPLNGGFADESWTVDGFKRNILKQREGKRPLLTGDLTVTLKNGVGVISGDVTFSDNSSWTWSGKFRLGAELTGGGAVEARTEAFVCKDQRGESYKKHHPPYPGDKVWRLEKIAKGGKSATRLHNSGVTTVKDFRRLHATDPNTLLNILGGGISNKTLKSILSHAMDCVLDETECYVYNANAKNISLLFNSVYEVIKVSFNGGTVWENVEQLTIDQPFLNQLKLEAYQNLRIFTAVNGRNFVDHPQRSLQCLQNPGFGIACPELQINFQDPCPMAMIQPEMPTSFETSPATTLYIDEKFLPAFRNSDQVHGKTQLLPVVTRGYTENDEDENVFVYHHHHDMPWSPGTVHWTQQMLQEDVCFSVSGTEEAGTYDVRIANIVGSPRARWCKIKAAFKLREVWRHTTARNRRHTCLPY